jgi:NAD(P)-dependent dehydrogenase (short-subunit alcohol dehydrogenase family)
MGLVPGIHVFLRGKACPRAVRPERSIGLGVPGSGRRIAVGLAEAGADVALFDLPSSEGLAATRDRIAALGRRALITSGDVTEAAAIERAIAAAERDLGPIEACVNAAGIANACPAENMPLPQWQTHRPGPLAQAFRQRYIV